MRTHWAVVVLAGAILACRSASTAGIAPPSLSVAHAWVDLPSDLDLVFRLDGAPLKDPQFTVALSSNEKTPPLTCDVLPLGPLGVPPKLRCTPTAEGEFTLTLQVKTEAHSFDVPVHIHAESPPDCLNPGPQPCQRISFDPTTGTCVSTNLPDDTICGDLICGLSSMLCRSGECVTIRDPNPMPPCAELPLQATDLMPTWTHTFQDRFLFSNPAGVVDAAGNVYLAVGDANGMSMELVSLDPQGQERWTQPMVFLEEQGWTSCLTVEGMKFLIVGEQLLVASPCLLRPFQARRLSDGVVAWDKLSAVDDVVDTGGGRLMALESNGWPMIADLAVIDAASGEKGQTVPLSASESLSMVSDGQGTAFVDAEMETGEVNLALRATGALWRSVNSDRMERVIRATDGQRLFLQTGEIVSAADGTRQALIPNISGAQGIVSASEATYAVVSSTQLGCESSAVLERIDPSSGTPLWRCHVENSFSFPWRPLLLRGGGVGLLASLQGTQFLGIYDEEGNSVMQGTASVNLLNALVSDGRLWAPSTDGRSLAAFDVPALALAEHGWVMSGGNPGNSGAPR